MFEILYYQNKANQKHLEMVNINKKMAAQADNASEQEDQLSIAGGSINLLSCCRSWCDGS